MNDKTSLERVWSWDDPAAGDKVSWLEDGERHYGFITCTIDRRAYVTAMIKTRGKYSEIPLEQLRLEHMG